MKNKVCSTTIEKIGHNRELTGPFCPNKDQMCYQVTLNWLFHENKRNCCTTYAERWNSMLRWTQNFVEHESVRIPKASETTGALSHQRERVSDCFVWYSNECLRRMEQGWNIPRSWIHDIRQNQLHKFPYKLQIIQQPEIRNHTAGSEFERWDLQKIEVDSSFLNWVICLEECVFHVDWKGNKLNVRIWRTENADETSKVAKDSVRVAVRCGMYTNQIFVPYYFEGLIVTAESYKQLRTHYSFSMLLGLPPDIIFQPDSALLHYRLEVGQLLNEKLPDFWIRKRGLFHWPNRSPDLTLLDFLCMKISHR